MSNQNRTGSDQAQRRLFDVCCDTFERFRLDYPNIEGHSMDYGLIADLGKHYRGFYIAVFGQEEFHPEYEKMETLSCEGGPYDIVGTIVGGQVNFSCSEDKLKTFFTSTGKAMLLPARVNDFIKARKLDALSELDRQREEERKAEKAAKRTRREEASQPASTNDGTPDDPPKDSVEEDTAVNEEKADRKREKRRAKEKRRKEQRQEEAEMKKEMEKERADRIREEVKAQLRARGQSDVDIQVYDPNTIEGREAIRKAQESNEGTMFSVQTQDLE